MFPILRTFVGDGFLQKRLEITLLHVIDLFGEERKVESLEFGMITGVESIRVEGVCSN